MKNLDVFRNHILDSLQLSKYKYQEVFKKAEIEKVNKVSILDKYLNNIDFSYNLQDIFFADQDEIKELSLELTRVGKIKEAIDVTFEIEDPGYLYSHFNQMLRNTIDYCVQNLDFKILEKLLPIAAHHIDYKYDKDFQYSFLEIEFYDDENGDISIIDMIIEGLIEISKSFIEDKLLYNQVIEAILEIYEILSANNSLPSTNRFIRYLSSDIKEAFLDNAVKSKISEFIETANSIEILEYDPKNDSIVYKQAFIINSFNSSEPMAEDWYQMIEENSSWSINSVLNLSNDSKKLIDSEDFNLYNEYWNLHLRNGGQFGDRPYFTKNTVSAAVKSNILNLLFFRHCQIDEDFQAEESGLMRESIKLANSINNQPIRNRSYQLISAVYVDAACLKNKQNQYFIKYLERAIYWASAVSDLGDMGCKCGKYSGYRYKGLICDKCKDTVSLDGGHQRDAYNYLFNALDKMEEVLEIDSSIFKQISKLDNNKKNIFNSFLLKSLLLKSYPVSFSQIIDERIVLRYKESSVNNYLNKIKSNLDKWSNENLIKTEESWYTNNISENYPRYNELIQIEDEEEWEEISFLKNHISKDYVWEEVSPCLEQWDIDEKTNKPTNYDFKENLQFYYPTGYRNLPLDYMLFSKEIKHEDSFIISSIDNYINEEAFNKNFNFSINILLEIFLKLLEKYYESNKVNYLKNCYSDFLKILNNVDNNEISNKFYSEILKLVIMNKDISKYNLANNIIFESTINLFSTLFIEKHSFIDSIKLSAIYKDSIVRSLSNYMVLSKQKDLKSSDNKMIYLTNFNSYPTSIRTFLNYELNIAISEDEIDKIDLLGQVIDISDYRKIKQT